MATATRVAGIERAMVTVAGAMATATSMAGEQQQ